GKKKRKREIWKLLKNIRALLNSPLLKLLTDRT
ncbi:hypothetical protein TorRG33x02_310910, partial [Trema orientale]